MSKSHWITQLPLKNIMQVLKSNSEEFKITLEMIMVMENVDRFLIFISFICIYNKRLLYIHIKLWASQVALVVKNLPANARDSRNTSSISGSGRSPGGGRSSVPWRIPGTEEPCILWSLGSQRVRHDWRDCTVPQHIKSYINIYIYKLADIFI